MHAAHSSTRLKIITQVSSVLTWRWQVLLAFVLLLPMAKVQAEDGSATKLLSGFDQARLQGCFPPVQENSLSELCKLVYRLRGVEKKTLHRLATETTPEKTGDAIHQKGTLLEVKRVEVPKELQEYLNLELLYFLQIDAEAGPFRVITSRLPNQAKAGDLIQATGILLLAESDPAIRAVVTGSVGWFATREMNQGEKLLQTLGFDLSLLSGLVQRNRLPLLPQDGDAFYSMLSAAKNLSDSQKMPTPRSADPITFLRDQGRMIAEWVQIEIEGVQITRIAVESLERQKQLESNHYFQIDAIGDLGEVIVKVESEGDKEPVVFKTRYPVSIVTKDLPKFLQKDGESIQPDRSIVRPLRGKLSVDGFFFRLWSYESEFMKQKGGESQFGPLIIAANLRNMEPQSVTPIGVEKIGTVAAAVIVSGILGIWLWLSYLARQDQEIKQRRAIQQSDHVNLDFDSLKSVDPDGIAPAKTPNKTDPANLHHEQEG